MNLFRRKLKLPDVEDGKIKHERFTKTAGTYKYTTFLLAICLMYPNPSKDKKRLKCLCVALLVFMLPYVLFLHQSFLCVINRDIGTFCRHVAIGIPLLVGHGKVFVSWVYRKSFKSLIDEVDDDYESYNHASDEIKEIAVQTIKKCKTIETWWPVAVGCSTCIFPLWAAKIMIYNTLFTAEPTRVMIHEMNVWIWSDEDKYKSPTFEFLFLYMGIGVLILFLSFSAYVGMFSVFIFHACLKFRIICKMLDHAFDDAHDVPGIKRKLVAIVKEQCRTFEFVERIQYTYQVWLAVLYLLTACQLVLTLYQSIGTDKGEGLDFRYLTLIVNAVIYFFLPCTWSTKVSTMAASVSDAAYCAGWERVPDTDVRRTTAIIIARSQIPLRITALNVITYNMEIFVSMMNTSYSVYAILRS